MHNSCRGSWYRQINTSVDFDASTSEASALDFPARMAIAQLSLDLTQPINHHERLHNAPHGAVLYWEASKAEKRWTKVMPGDPVAKIVSSFSGESDTYLTVNQFHDWRTVRQLKSLRCCYVDVDGTDDLDTVLDALRSARMPAPSFVVFSGRGLHCYWSLSPTPSQALPVWQRIQDALVSALAHIGSDSKARDCTRVLRLVGTRNAKNDAEVRGVVLTDSVWSLHELADEVLGAREPKPATVFDFAAASARKSKPAGRPRTGSIYDWWHLVYRDLCAITDFHWFGGVPAGHRDQILFLMSVSLSWFAHVDVLEDEIVRTAHTFTPTLTQQEIQTQMAPVIKRAQASAAGKTALWQGAQVDPRYRFKAETLREWLGDLIPAELHSQLRALAPADVIKARKKERDSARYEKRRDEYLKVHSESADQRAATARLMKTQGSTVKEIQAALGVSRASVFNYLKEV